jgi:effector-binding domain-containing protein
MKPGNWRVVAAAGLLFNGWFCSQQVIAQPEELPWSVGRMIVQTIPERRYLSASIDDTNFARMGEPVVKTLTAMGEAAKEHKTLLHGPVLHYYYGAPHTTPNKSFKMETGFLFPERAEAVGDFKVRVLPRYKCASVLYVGPASQIGDAWQELYRSVRSQQLTPTDEERELYLYWESADSPNNIVQVQVGIQ